MRVTIDIHHFEQQFTDALGRVNASTTSDRNKALIRQFVDACLLRQVCGKVRLIRAMSVLVLVAEALGKDYDRATREDFERVLSNLLRHEPAYSPETIATYKRILRRFLSYVASPEDFPQRVPPAAAAWINGHLRKRDRPMIRRSDLLTPSEVQGLLTAAANERDRAFISILWEAGPRVAEIGNMQLKHVNQNGVGYTLDITGKTGTRSPLIITSAPYLSAWLAVHPCRDDPEAPLWVHRRTKAPIAYNAISVMLRRTFRRAGITKPSHPHMFRHSRVTYVLANGIMNEQQAKRYFGWTPDSDMPGSTYAHLIDADVNNAILRENNLAPHQQAARELQPIKCTICGELNPPRTDYCEHCQAVLNLSRAYEHQQLHDLKEELFARMFKVMVDRGLVDDAAREIHDAQLGGTLKRLAQHINGEVPIAQRFVSRPVNQDDHVVKTDTVL